MKKDNKPVLICLWGMDTHKDSIQIVTAEAGADGEVRPYGQIAGDLAMDGWSTSPRSPWFRLR